MLTGLILTNTHRLGSILSTTQNRIVEVISSYALASAPYIDWQLVDIADELYVSCDKNDWRTCASALNDYYVGLGLHDKNYCPLFILGGDDIVPMPKMLNPYPGTGREYLDSDMAYCFELPTVRVRLKDFVSLKPRFAVGRLPLTKDWSLDGLIEYLNQCVDFAANGIPIRGAAMTTTQSWLRASNEMMMDIPAVKLSEDYVPLNNRMIVSPELDTDYKDWYDGYVHELNKIDFLVCNLHGSKEKNEPYFAGESIPRMQPLPKAIQPAMLSKTTPYIFNTVACYGARYNRVEDFDGRFIDYELGESMMMTALAYGTMLYCGACDAALGGNANYPATCSELMMKFYNIYLHQGIPAGMALLKAKQDYYRRCYNSEGADEAMFTVLEFNLFGCPILSMQPKIDVDYVPALTVNPVDEYAPVDYRPKNREVVFGGAHHADDIYAYVRGLVDRNLSIIRQKVEVEVYQRLGLGKDNLHQVMRVSQDNRALGYQFIYIWSPHESYRSLNVYYFVDTDINGNIVKILQSK